MLFNKGWLQTAKHRASPHFDSRPADEISLLVIHNISLPAGEFGHQYVDDLFMGQLDCQANDSFHKLEGLRVSANFFIRRDGELIQYVSCDDRAWHAGLSEFDGKSDCNDFSIGIELEGTDHQPFNAEQYHCLITLTQRIMTQYPSITKQRITGHSDIASGRKTDPGPYFDWQYYLTQLS